MGIEIFPLVVGYDSAKLCSFYSAKKCRPNGPARRGGPSKKEVDKIMLLPPQTLVEIDGYGKQHTNEFNHFIIQAVRLPRTEGANIRKIIQVGLNIGQYIGSGGTKKKWMTINTAARGPICSNTQHKDILDSLIKTLFPKL
jgi:hypothetical protein